MSEQLVPAGYRPVAVRDDRQGKCVISFNRDLRLFYFTVNKASAGPFNEKDLRQLMENIKDVLSMKGSFHYIDGYDAQGNQTI
jgi:hypothetical protein